MELSRKQQIIAAVVFFLVIGSAAAVYMITSYERMNNDESRISAEESRHYLKVKRYAHETLKSYANNHNCDFSVWTGPLTSVYTNYWPQLVINQGEENVGFIKISQQIDLSTSDISCLSRLYCTGNSWDETVNLMKKNLSKLSEVHSLFGSTDFSEELLMEFVSMYEGSAGFDACSGDDADLQSDYMVLRSGYYSKDGQSQNPYYYAKLELTDTFSEEKAEMAQNK
ncbi:MAG: hypothetical protein ACI4U1_04160 [Anaerovoracaceae bacterium]